MRRMFLGLLAGLAFLLVARWAWIALAPAETKIRWRLEEMSAGFNETRLAPCMRGVAEDWRHDDGRVNRDLLADLLRSVFFHEKEPETGRFPLRAEIEPESLLVTLDEQDSERARAELVGLFSVLDKGSWSLAWRARITLELRLDPEQGWQVSRSAHEDLEADGRFLGMR